MQIQLILLTISICFSQCDEVSYYEKIITDQIKSSLDFIYPANASEFAARNEQPQQFGHYDFIIVGSGSTGSVLANRLSQVRHWKILLLEAGVFGNDVTAIPDMMSTVALSNYNWAFFSTPQNTCCLDMPGNKCEFTRGKGIGGTSLLNGMTYVRGNKWDFDLWEKLGNPGWSYKKVLPFFMKNENFRTTADVPVDREYHGTTGELTVEVSRPRHPLIDYWLRANKEKGYEILDYNGRKQTGAAVIQVTTNRGKRADFGTSFIKPILNRRKNLTVLSKAYVTKVIFQNKTAKGVQFTYKGKTFIAEATKEVILSAGVFGSPQILMLSGIGPRKHLVEVGIDVVLDLPVGNNLKEHATFWGLTFEANFTKTHLPLREYIKQFLKGEGPLTAPHFNGGMGFYQTENANLTDYADIELVMFPNDYFSAELGQNLSRAREKSWETLNLAGTFSIFVIALHAKSVGTVRLQSSNPHVYPIINPRLLSDSGHHDITSLYKGIKLVLDLIKTGAYAEINATLIKQKVPECENEEYLSDSYWFCVLPKFTGTFYHPVGTCKMGSDGVVDARNRVHGVKSLRVADSSIFPLTLSGHPNSVCGMIGEKVADMLKSEYNNWRG